MVRMTSVLYIVPRAPTGFVLDGFPKAPLTSAVHERAGRPRADICATRSPAHVRVVGGRLGTSHTSKVLEGSIDGLATAHPFDPEAPRPRPGRVRRRAPGRGLRRQLGRLFLVRCGVVGRGR